MEIWFDLTEEGRGRHGVGVHLRKGKALDDLVEALESPATELQPADSMVRARFHKLLDLVMNAAEGTPAILCPNCRKGGN